jgi:hypothetical protein
MRSLAAPFPVVELPNVENHRLAKELVTKAVIGQRSTGRHDVRPGCDDVNEGEQVNVDDPVSEAMT